MSKELHDYLRDARSSIISQIDALRTGQLVAWDISVHPRRDISDERIAAYEGQLLLTEELMKKLGVSFDN